jgi:thymidylate kinase
MLGKTAQLFGALNAERLRYCHWKSNVALDHGLQGGTDIDLLIHREDASAFRAILARSEFKPAAGTDGTSFPSTEHYFALDPGSGLLVHVHVYFRVITGESLAKNLCLPLENMLLEHTRWEDAVRVPTRSAELVIFTLRMMLKHSTLVELILLARDWAGMQRELAWLLDGGSAHEAAQLLSEWLPVVDTALFLDCVDALRSTAPLMTRVRLGRRLRRNLRMYSRRSPTAAAVTGIRTFLVMAWRRLTRSNRGLVLRSGGAVVAFVGAEATGKSTLIDETRRWLGEHFVVDHIHAGKPPATVLSAVPSLAVPLLRAVLPNHRPTSVERARASDRAEATRWRVYPLSFAVRSVLLAYDRQALLTRAFARAAGGAIVLCDRFPNWAKDAPDGPRLMHHPVPRGRYPVRHFLAALERRLYLRVPSPTLILALTVPLDVALARNRARGKHEPEDYVRWRHSRNVPIDAPRTRVHSLDTGRPLVDTVGELKRTIWTAL